MVRNDTQCLPAPDLISNLKTRSHWLRVFLFSGAKTSVVAGFFISRRSHWLRFFLCTDTLANDPSSFSSWKRTAKPKASEDQTVPVFEFFRGPASITFPVQIPTPVNEVRVFVRVGILKKSVWIQTVERISDRGYSASRYGQRRWRTARDLSGPLRLPYFRFAIGDRGRVGSRKPGAY